MQDNDIKMLCLGCGYDLRGQVEHRCPECGRAFDPHACKAFPFLRQVSGLDLSRALSRAECVFLPFRATFTLRAQLRLRGTCVLYGPLFWEAEHIEVQVEAPLVRRKGPSVQIQLERVCL